MIAKPYSSTAVLLCCVFAGWMVSAQSQLPGEQPTLPESPYGEGEPLVEAEEPSHPQDTCPSSETRISESQIEPEPLPVPISLTTSGGVSLGGYQAGYLYYLSEVIKRNPSIFDARVLTGSSAGTINSMIALISLGSEPWDDPRESLFYEIWTGIKYQELLDVENAPTLALSSRRVMDDLADRMEEVWVNGLSEKLDMVMGATATRLEGRSVGLSDDFSVPRQEEKFVFRVRGRGFGKAPLVTNYVDRSHGIAQPLLPFSDPRRAGEKGAARSDFEVLKQVMFASSAFPLAFPPQEVDFCMSSPGVLDDAGADLFRDCVSPKYHELFVDGSMFDRNPLGLAHRTAKAGLSLGEGGLGWRKNPDVELGVLPRNFFFVYLDSSHSSYPEAQEKDDKGAKTVGALFPAFGAYSQGFVRAAQAKELYTLVDGNPGIKGRVEFTKRDLPAASGLLANFFGFFDRKFRSFDFYLGMHDARKYVERTMLTRIRETSDEDVRIVYPEDASAGGDPASWSPYFCLRSEIDEVPEYEGTCDGRGMRDFRILLQVALDRVYDHCRRFPEDETLDHLHCKRAMGGERPPWVVASSGDNDSGWMRGEDETQFQHTMRLLKRYDFWFEDLGLDRDDAWLAMSKIREELAGRMDEFAKKLPPGERILLRTVGKPALNFFQYQPPRAIIYLGGGKGTEVGLSVTSAWVPTRWLRFNMAIQFQGILQALSLAPNVFAATPLLGLELEIPQLGGPVFQWRIGARVGFQLSTSDHFYRDSCDFRRFEDDSAHCSAPVGQLIVIFSFYERVRIQGGVEWFPYFLSPMKERGENSFNGLLQVGWQWISPF